MTRRAALALVSLSFLTVAFAAFALLRPPSVDDGLRVMGAAAARQLDGLFQEASATPEAEFTATYTPFATMTALPSSTLTPTATQQATEIPSATPTEIEDVAVSLEKYDLHLPGGVGPHERWIEVNLSEQTLTAWEGVDQIDTFVISSGRANTPTVTGTFKIWIKVPLQDMSGPGYYVRDVPWVMFFYKDYGIHGTWWHNNFGNPMSAGCVNMTVEDSKWMYNWASVGTVVQVHY